MDLTGRILVASPTLLDPNFSRTVVLICAHDEEGAFGVVLNRPTDLDAVDHLPAWHGVLADPAVVFWGGPVATEHAMVVAEPRGIVEGVDQVVGAIAIADAALPEPDDDTFLRARVFAGHAGWSAGQLDTEVADDDWFVGAAHPDDPFLSSTDQLWRDALRRRGDRLAIYGDYPPDPRLN